MEEKLLSLRKLQHETSWLTNGCGAEAGTPDSLYSHHHCITTNQAGHHTGEKQTTVHDHLQVKDPPGVEQEQAWDHHQRILRNSGCWVRICHLRNSKGELLAGYQSENQRLGCRSRMSLQLACSGSKTTHQVMLKPHPLSGPRFPHL